jgi:transcriptional regulator with XRE-family HTH domain
MAKGGQPASGSALASVTSLVDRRVKLQNSSGEIVKLPRRQLGDNLTPYSHSSSADIQGSSNLGLASEMSNGGLFSHTSKLSMPSSEMQPYLVNVSLSLLNMSSQAWKRCETLADRLQWSIEHANVSQASLAVHLKISSAALSEWFTSKVKNPKLKNIYKAAQFCKVNSWWLAIGEGSPYDGIDSQFDGISGQDLIIAKGLSELADNSLRGTVQELIAARKTAQEENIHKKRKA